MSEQISHNPDDLTEWGSDVRHASSNLQESEIILLKRQIAELSQQLTDIKREWISVKYKLPIGREEVLYFDGEEVGTFMPEIGIDSEYWSAERCSQFGVTHWMPFPKPPTP